VVIDQSHWVDVRKILRTPGSEKTAYIEVPKENVLQSVTLDQLFMNAGVQQEIFIPTLESALEALVQFRSNNGSLPISYFDLFTQGLTNICRSIYFSMDLVMKAAEANLSMAKSEFSVGLGQPEFEFIFGYIRFLVAQHLADVDFTDCLIDWQDREMVPRFIAPLTSRGREMVTLIHALEQEFVEQGKLPPGGGLHVAQEGFVEMVELSYFGRLPRIREFQNVVMSRLQSSTVTA
jgi:hypothetical protein